MEGCGGGGEAGVCEVWGLGLGLGLGLEELAEVELSLSSGVKY